MNAKSLADIILQALKESDVVTSALPDDDDEAVDMLEDAFLLCVDRASEVI